MAHFDANLLVTLSVVQPTGSTKTSAQTSSHFDFLKKEEEVVKTKKMDIKKEKQQDEEEDELEDVEIQELLEKKKKLEHDLEIIYDKKEVKHEVFDVESSASEKEDKFKDEKLYNLDKILSKKIKNSSGKEIVIIKKHYDDKVGLNVFYCQICEKSVDGETNLKTHIFGVRHLRNEVVWPTLDKTKSQSSRRSEGMNFLI